jgi:hypothetical protein
MTLIRALSILSNDLGEVSANAVTPSFGLAARLSVFPRVAFLRSLETPGSHYRIPLALLETQCSGTES